MIVKSYEEAKGFGVQTVDVESVLCELLKWQRHCEDDGGEDSVRFAMINSFEDIILNSLVEE